MPPADVARGSAARGVDEGLPSTVGAFCSSPCAADSDCGPDARCGEIGLGDGAVCVPDSCSCLYAAADATLLGAAVILKAAGRAMTLAEGVDEATGA